MYWRCRRSGFLVVFYELPEFIFFVKFSSNFLFSSTKASSIKAYRPICSVTFDFLNSYILILIVPSYTRFPCLICLAYCFFLHQLWFFDPNLLHHAWSIMYLFHVFSATLPGFVSLPQDLFRKHSFSSLCRTWYLLLGYSNFHKPYSLSLIAFVVYF